jgi:molybdopterin converting factor small subunit
MKVVVKAYALLKERTGEGEIALDVEEGSTVRHLIALLGERYGQDIASLLLTSSGEIDSDVLISHNDVRITNADTPLSQGDLVLFLSPMPGG